MPDLIKLRRELNQLIINAFTSFIGDKTGSNKGQFVCSRKDLPIHIKEVLMHYSFYIPKLCPGRITCNKCKHFDDFTIDRASFIID